MKRFQSMFLEIFGQKCQFFKFSSEKQKCRFFTLTEASVYTEKIRMHGFSQKLADGYRFRDRETNRDRQG